LPVIGGRYLFAKKEGSIKLAVVVFSNLMTIFPDKNWLMKKNVMLI